jgi:hypothetical protein
MKTASLTLIVAIALSTGAVAQTRPLTLGMGCGQARALVTSRGAVVLSTGQNTYDRYVSSGAFCQWGLSAVGYTCVPNPPDIGWLSSGRKSSLE